MTTKLSKNAQLWIKSKGTRKEYSLEDAVDLILADSSMNEEQKEALTKGVMPAYNVIKKAKLRMTLILVSIILSVPIVIFGLCQIVLSCKQ